VVFSRLYREQEVVGVFVRFHCRFEIELHSLLPKGVKLLLTRNVFARASYVLSARLLITVPGASEERWEFHDAVRSGVSYVRPASKLWLNQHVDYESGRTGDSRCAN
jgi:hypothetical protein